MKEDVLEQVTEDFLQMRGYFTRHNVRYRPPVGQGPALPAEAVRSDIDVVALNPHLSGPDRVMAVSCKSWQSGFNAVLKLKQLRGDSPDLQGRVRSQFRELCQPQWAQGFRDCVRILTGEPEFTYCIAVTRLTGSDADSNAADWNGDPVIREHLGGNPVRFLTLGGMWAEFQKNVTTTPAASEIRTTGAAAEGRALANRTVIAVTVEPRGLVATTSRICPRHFRPYRGPFCGVQLVGCPACAQPGACARCSAFQNPCRSACLTSS
jgi:hypothetical protein